MGDDGDDMSPGEQLARERLLDASHEVYTQVVEYQAEKFTEGSVENLLQRDLDVNSLSDWVLFIAKYATFWLMKSHRVDKSKENYEQFRKGMVKVGALALSAIVWAETKIRQIEAYENLPPIQPQPRPTTVTFSEEDVKILDGCLGLDASKWAERVKEMSDQTTWGV